MCKHRTCNLCGCLPHKQNAKQWCDAAVVATASAAAPAVINLVLVLGHVKMELLCCPSLQISGTVIADNQCGICGAMFIGFVEQLCGLCGATVWALSISVGKSQLLSTIAGYVEKHVSPLGSLWNNICRHESSAEMVVVSGRSSNNSRNGWC